MGIKELEQNMKELKELLEDKKTVKEKRWRYPLGSKVGKAQRKKNYITIIMPHENGTIIFKKYQITDQTVLHEKIPRLANAGYVMFDKKGNPVIILPNWSVEPFSPLEHYQQSLINGTNKKGYAILMEKMQKEQINPKKQVSGWVKWIFGLGVAAIIIYALMTGGV